VELGPLPYVLAPCARAEYESRPEQTLLEVEDGSDPTLGAKTFMIPMVSYNNPMVHAHNKRSVESEFLSTYY
jgi:hypothetical protein